MINFLKKFWSGLGEMAQIVISVFLVGVYGLAMTGIFGRVLEVMTLGLLGVFSLICLGILFLSMYPEIKAWGEKIIKKL